MDTQMNKITTIEELLKANEGSIVELPPFAEGIPFVARLKRPSMMSLAKNGKIPNELLNSANQLFSGKNPISSGKGSDNDMSQLFDLLDVICEAAFVEPSFQAIKDAGIELTDEQYTFVFNWTQQGVKALNSFR